MVDIVIKKYGRKITGGYKATLITVATQEGDRHFTTGGNAGEARV